MPAAWLSGTCAQCGRVVIHLGASAPYCRRCSSERVGRALGGERVELTDHESRLLQLNYQARRISETAARRRA